MIRTSTQEQARLEDSYGRDIPEGTVCCFCGKPLASIAVFWLGQPREAERMDQIELWLHPVCSVDLSVYLLRDVHEIEQTSGVGTDGLRALAGPAPDDVDGAPDG